MTETVETVIARAIFGAQFTERQLASIGMTGATSSPYTEQLAAAVAAALDNAGYAVVRKATLPADEFEAWLREHHSRVGVTPALRQAHDAYLAAREPSP